MNRIAVTKYVHKYLYLTKSYNYGILKRINDIGNEDIYTERELKYGKEYRDDDCR